ncbi:uncharacterized protein LOC134720896 isoform X1 [Mytilus trossulus]|uniref:uncharacterized protein LOC134720896 isoform X1 n=1 Tax=Mytilus trossulus TaxID=6551 RepID=UPI00300543F5
MANLLPKSDIFCGPCESQNLTNVAELWCPNCNEGLCSKCMEYHKVSKASRMHKTITIENLTALPEFVRNIDHVCTSHGNVLELYCSVHEKVCCIDCVSTEHSECPGITSLAKVVRGVKESEFYHSVVSHIEEITEFGIKLQNNRYENLARLQQEKDFLFEKVKLKCTEVTTHFDGLEKHLKQQIASTIAQQSEHIYEVISRLQKKESALKEYQKQISTIKENATDLQVFWGLTKIESNVAGEEANFECLTEESVMKEASVKMRFTQKFERLINSMKRMGNIEINIKNSDIHFSRTKSQIAKKLLDIQPGIENIKLTFVTKFQLPFDVDINICCCAILPDERVVMANNNSSADRGGMHILSENGEYQFRVVCSSSPFGLAVINKSDIAVSFYKERSIKIYDLENFNVKHVLLEGHYFFGLSVESGCLVSAVRDVGIYFISCTSGKILKTIPCDTKNLTYVHLMGENAFVSDYEKNILYCRNRDGETVWKYSSDAMKGPRNMCTDTVGNIFVATFESHSIIAISPDGKTYKKLLGFEDGFKFPKALYFSANTSSLVVVSQLGSARKYRLSYA